MCQLSNTATNNDMKQGNFGTIYNFKHSKKKKKKLTKNSSGGIAGQQLSALISGTCRAERSSGEPRARRPSQAGAGGVGAEGSPPPRAVAGGAAAASSRRAARRDWAVLALVAVGRCGNMFSSKAFCSAAAPGNISYMSFSQRQSWGGPCPPRLLGLS